MSLSHLSARELSHLDAVCLDYEQRRRRGEPVDIEQLVQAHGGEHADDLRAELQGVAAEIDAAQIDAAQFGSGQIGSGQFGSGPFSAAGPATMTLQRSAMMLSEGSLVGPYRIQRQIGRGGMGEVYLGRDERLQRDVAIKILMEDWAKEPDRLDRFDRENRAVAALSHPNIVSLYDIGNHQGRPYAVMELLVGETLRDRLRRGPHLDADQVRRIGAAAADALAAAHTSGIIHRDLKPENLFQTQDGVIKLLDFGLSRTHSDAGDAGQPTATGVILGTMGYLSPEQANGRGITPSTDLFSLGCVLHECFYGARPFGGDTVAESLAATINAAPTIDPQRAASDPQLAEVIARCLEKQPHRRFATAIALAAALRDRSAILPTSAATELPAGGHSTIVIHPTSAATDRLAIQPKDPRLSRRAVFRGVGLTAVAASGAGGLAGLVHWLRQPPAIRSVAVLPLSDGLSAAEPAHNMATRQLGQGEQLAAAIADQLTRVTELRVVPFLPLRDNGLDTPRRPGSEAEFPERTPEFLKETAEHLGVDAILVGSVASDLDGYQTIDVKLVEGRTGFQIGTYTTRVKEKTNLIDQVQTAQKVAEGIGQELAVYRGGGTHKNGSYHCLVNGYSRMDTESVDALRDALQCFKNAIRQDEKFPEAYAGLALTAMILVGQVEFKERTQLVELARGASKNALELEYGSRPAQLATAMLDWQVDWEFDSAARTFELCVPQMPDSWVAQHEYALFLAAQERFTDAKGHAERAVSLDPTSAAFRLDKARVYWFGGETSVALDEIRAVIAAGKGPAQQLAVGAALDLLEQLRRRSEASRLLAEHGFPGAGEDYWNVRLESLKQLPYGPFDAQLNRLILDVRRGEQIDEQRLLELRAARPPRLPLLVSAHPALASLRNHASLRDLIVSPRYRS